MDAPPDALRVQILSRDNDAGLSRDIVLLRDTLQRLGYHVTVTTVGHYHSLQSRLHRGRSACLGLKYRITGRRHVPFDVNLMLERFCPAFFIQAKYNVLIPNPEWVRRIWMKYLPRFDLVSVKTRHAMPIFERYGCATRWIGWISHDNLDPATHRERTFLHVAGLSDAKGTPGLLGLWARHPDWPELHVVWRHRDAQFVTVPQNVRLVTRRLDSRALRTLQNQCCFHLCPSRTEGFGHYIAEALGVGAVCITTDAAPMNELVTPDRGLLVSATATGTQNLATLYDFDEPAMCAAIERCIAMPDRECTEIGQRARHWFEQNGAEFPARVSGMLDSLGETQRAPR